MSLRTMPSYIYSVKTGQCIESVKCPSVHAKADKMFCEAGVTDCSRINLRNALTEEQCNCLKPANYAWIQNACQLNCDTITREQATTRELCGCLKGAKYWWNGSSCEIDCKSVDRKNIGNKDQC